MRYRTIVADPPWRYRNTRGTQTRSRIGRRAITAEGNYPTMSVEEIASISVGDFAAEQSHCYLWVTVPLMFEVRPEEILTGWGFDYVTTLTWVKTGPPGLGFYFRGETEHCVFGIRGGLGIPAALRRSNVIRTPRRGHSVKPDAFYDIVEQVSPGPYLELFARRQRLGWDSWGNEALCHVDLGDAS